MPKRKKPPPPPKRKRPLTVHEAGRRGGKARLRSMSPAERSRLARKAAKIRWEKEKE